MGLRTQCWGNTFIDDDHRHWIALLSNLCGAMDEGKAQHALEAVLADRDIQPEICAPVLYNNRLASRQNQPYGSRRPDIS